MYLVYESLYGELLQDNDSTYIIGLYDTREKAIKKAKELIAEEIEIEHHYKEYVLDEERNNIDRDGFVRLFWGHQENWNCFYEIIVEELEVNKEE